MYEKCGATAKIDRKCSAKKQGLLKFGEDIENNLDNFRANQLLGAAREYKNQQLQQL